MNKKHRKKKVLFFLLVFLIIIIGIAWLITLKVDSLEQFISIYIQKYGFFGILFFSFLADVLVQPIGPEILALFGIFWNLNIIGILIFTILGSYIGSLVSFYIGKKYFADKLKEVYEIEESGQNIKYSKVLRIFRRYGKWGLGLAAISPVPWVVFCWLVGSFKMKMKQFIFYGLIPRGIRIFIVLFGAEYLRGFLL